MVNFTLYIFYHNKKLKCHTKYTTSSFSWILPLSRGQSSAPCPGDNRQGCPPLSPQTARLCSQDPSHSPPWDSQAISRLRRLSVSSWVMDINCSILILEKQSIHFFSRHHISKRKSHQKNSTSCRQSSLMCSAASRPSPPGPCLPSAS